MKKVFAILAASLSLMLVSACGTSGTSSTPAPAVDTTMASSAAGTAEEKTTSRISKGDKVGISLTSRSAERWLRDGQTLEKMLTKAGYKVDLQYADSLPQNQIQQMENMVTAGCKAIIVAPVDNGSLSSVLKSAKEQNVVIINYDLGIIGSSDIDYFVGFDNSKVGEMQADAIIKGLGLDKGEKGPFYIELFAGSLAEANCYMYFNGAMEKLKPYLDSGSLVIKSGQNTIEQATVVDWKLELLASRLDNLLTTFYSDGTLLNAVLSPSDYLSGPISTRLMEIGYGAEGMKMPIITGNDATQAIVKMIVKDQVTMSVFKDTRLLAKACVDILDALSEGKEPVVNATYTPDKYEIPTVFVDMYSLDKTNMDSLAIETGYYTKEQVYS